MRLNPFKRKPTEDYATSVPAPLEGAFYVPGLPTFGFSAWAGPLVTDFTALALPAFYRGVNIICDHVAMSCFEAWRKGADGTQTLVDPQPQILTNPTPGEIPYDVWFQLAWSLVLRGNAFAYLTNLDALGYPRSMVVLNPDVVSVEYDPVDGSIAYNIAGKSVNNGLILHIRGHRPPGSPLGVGVVAVAREALGHGIALQEYSARYFAEAGVPPGTIDVPGDVTPEAATRLRKEWVQAHGNRHRSPAVLSGGMKFNALSISPEDQQLLESRRWSVFEVAYMLGIPPRVLGVSDQSLTYANLDAEFRHLALSLRPYTSRIEQALTNVLPRPQTVRADYDEWLALATVPDKITESVTPQDFPLEGNDNATD